MLLEDVLKEFIFDCTLRKMTDRTIEEYNGNNVSQLAQKYNYSERSIWRILKSKD